MKIKKIIKVLAAVFAICVFTARPSVAAVSVAQAFYELARQGNVSKIQSLLYRGYSLESKDKNGNTPLCLAVKNQNPRAYSLLASYGANKKPQCLQNLSKEEYISFFGYAPVSQGMTSYIPDEPYLIGAAALGAGAIATAYLLRGNTSGGGGGNGGNEGGNGGSVTPGPSGCPDNSSDVNGTCVCDQGYGNYGDSSTCHPTVENCKTQNKNICSSCNSGYTLQNNKCVSNQNCPENSTEQNGKCVCNTGYDHFGDMYNCYPAVSNCSNQSKATCNSCKDGYVLADNVCYPKIQNCVEQTGRTCEKCVTGYDVHNGDGTQCYKTIDNCKNQIENKCDECIDGYGTYGSNAVCYKTIDNCVNQIQDACKQCKPGWETLGGDYTKCWNGNPCTIEHTVPNKDGECVCDASKGYGGEPGSCVREEDGNYQEGDGNQEIWNNYNELYCNSHGLYIEGVGCKCYDGYNQDSEDCSSCAEGYLEFGGACYASIICGEGEVQSYNRCVCSEQYVNYTDENGKSSCILKIQCDLHQEQDGPNGCRCKRYFNEECTDCEEGYIYDASNDICISGKTCEDKWTGEDCDVCPSNYEVTEDGICGSKCASNRAPWNAEDNADCSVCADGYLFSKTDNNCIANECTSGTEGYVAVLGDDGDILGCNCDTEKGYRADVSGRCVRTEPDLIGQRTGNINNSEITIINDGVLRDVYGMKPLQDEEDENSYYDNVYNALSSGEDSTGIINITNTNTGNNIVYGIYSQSDIYNAAAINRPGSELSAVAKGEITITDDNTSSIIYGLYNSSENDIYNSFAFGSSQETTTNNSAEGSIVIKKSETSSGSIVGMTGGRSLYNAYAATDNGLGANVSAVGNINIEHAGSGVVYGMKGTTADYKINNALAYMNSLVSTTRADGTINVTGKENVYGISGVGTIANSETQFSRSFAVIPEFGSYGKIDATSSVNAPGEAVYGIYTTGTEDVKTTLYNALGYNSQGDIIVKNTGGGSAYGLYSKQQTYKKAGTTDEVYNDTFNAFRSSEKYGGENVAAKGNISAVIDGYSNLQQRVVGIFAAGNVYNAFTNSGSDVKLESIGTISIQDNSLTSKMLLAGIESNGATIANAYSMGTNKNTSTITTGNITVNVNATKNDVSQAVGIYSNKINPQGGNIYNAALINDMSNVSGTITIKSASNVGAPSNMYGIYATNENTTTSGTSQPKTVYNAYYENDAEDAGGKVTGIINVTADSVSQRADVGYYGIYVQEGNAYNAYTNNANADVRGVINVSAYGNNSKDKNVVAGMYGLGSDALFATLNNSGNSEINVTSKGAAKAYGIKGERAHIYNDAKVNVTGGSSSAYGIYVDKGSAINDVNGVITVNGSQVNYGIYALSDGTTAGKVEVINNGTINVNGAAGSLAIYAEGGTTTVTNNGTLIINGESCSGADCPTGTRSANSVSNSGIQLVDGAQYVNKGLTTSSADLDFDAMGGVVVLSEGGKFAASEDMSGHLLVAAETILDSFEEETVLSEALSAQNIDNLALSSESYLYSAVQEKAADDNEYNVVLKKKAFSEVTDNDKSSYFALNYENENNQELFNALKSAKNAVEYKQREADILGTSVLPNIVGENLKVMRSLDKTMLSELFKDGGDIRKMVGADGMYIGRDDHGTLSGYDITSESMYALYDKKMNNKYRLGLGISLTNIDTDYNNDSTRKSFLVQGYVPLTYTNGRGLTAVTMARLGYGDGDYKRYGYNKRYEADTNEITYGLLNEVRYKMDLGAVNFTPFIGLNAIGYYQDSIDEGNTDLALKAASSHIFSLESALGFYLDKYIEFDENNKLNVALGLGWYHEFADPYKGLNAQIYDTIGSYKLRDIEHTNSRNRGIISAKVNYDYKDFSIYGELMQYLEEEYPIRVDVGLKYKF